MICALRPALGARSKPEGIARRNITFSPKRGTPVVVTAKRPAREPAPTMAEAGSGGG